MIVNRFVPACSLFLMTWAGPAVGKFPGSSPRPVGRIGRDMQYVGLPQRSSGQRWWRQCLDHRAAGGVDPWCDLPARGVGLTLRRQPVRVPDDSCGFQRSPGRRIRHRYGDRDSVRLCRGKDNRAHAALRRLAEQYVLVQLDGPRNVIDRRSRVQRSRQRCQPGTSTSSGTSSIPPRPPSGLRRSLQETRRRSTILWSARGCCRSSLLIMWILWPPGVSNRLKARQPLRGAIHTQIPARIPGR